jgi:nitrogen fixation NifU-like protein
MSDNLDNFVQKLQKQIYEDTKEAYGLAAFDRWLNFTHRGNIDDPDGYARIKGRCGDTMEMFLKFKNERVKEACYLTDGCGSSNVCGSFAAEMALGKSPDELLEITGEMILEKLGGLPGEEEHCAFLSAETLHKALNDYMVKETGKKGSCSDQKNSEQKDL